MSNAADGPVVRSLDPDEFADFRAITDYAFHPTEGPQTYEDADLERLGERLGVFDDGDLVSVCVHYDFTARLRGEWTPIAGLAAVATPPEHRRRGYVRHLVDESLDRWRGEFPLAALWPFAREYYGQFGWATACKYVEYTCPPEALAFARGTADGRARRVTVEDWPALQEVREAYAADRTLVLRYDEDWWRERLFHAGEDDRPYVYAWERDGDVRGYVVYTVESAGDGIDHRRVAVDHLVFADDEAYRGLLGFLADHDSQASRVVFDREAESSLLDRVADPGEVTCEVSTGPMVRVVDVEHALSSCPYPEGETADLLFRVTDDTAAWNDGVFRLQVGDGDATCTRDADSGTATEARSVDVTVDIGTLSQLVVGYHTVDEARRLGYLSVADGQAADALETLFPGETVSLGTFF